MKLCTFALFVSTFCLIANPAYSDSIEGYRDAQRIIVITDDEAIHYAQFCGFYELRELLTESVENVSDSISVAGVPKFEVRVLAKSGEYQAYVGDHWISTDEGAALIRPATYKRILEHVEMRKGHGAAKSTVGKSVQQILGRIQDPAYVEQDMCPKR
jgi:hypothetical protein